MTNLLKVQEADEGASEQATETRRLLQEWADKHLPDAPADVVQAFTAEEVRALCATGAGNMLNSTTYLGRYAESGSWNPKSQFAALVCTFAHSTRAMFGNYNRMDHGREQSYIFEGTVREFHKRFYQAGMKWSLPAEYLAMLCLQVPRTTGQYQDQLYTDHCGLKTFNLNAIGPVRELTNDIQHYLPGHTRLAENMVAHFSSIAEWVVQASMSPDQYARLSPSRRLEWEYNNTAMNPIVHFNYMDADGPWIAGFLTPEDACRLKFSRVRLGAYLATQGFNDDEVRAKVEKAKQQVAAAEFHAVPNDCLWDEVYTGGISSCMAGNADEYETWDEIHPVHTYSSSYHGAGDNSLVLIYTKDGSEVTGRGILNLQKGSIVRWYGSAIAQRVLKRAEVNTDDRYALRGTWLALIQKAKRFIHPYTDGDLGYGNIEDGRVYISDDSDHPCLQDTSGSSYLGEVFYCEDLDADVGEDECTHQPLHNTYVSDDCDDSWLCPVSGEYCHPSSRMYMDIYGVSVEVSDYLNQDRYQRAWLFELPNGDWGIQDDQRDDEFKEYHGIDEDDAEEEDEEDAA